MRAIAVCLLALLAFAAAAPQTPISEVALRNLQLTFNVPCSVCTALVSAIEQKGEDQCVGILQAACAKFQWNCSDVVVTAACGIVKVLLQSYTPDKICANWVHCTPGAMQAALMTPLSEVARQQMQSTFNIPCSICTSVVGAIETEGEDKCVDIVNAACTKFKWNCNPTIVAVGCSVVKALLQTETPDKICNNWIHCTPGAVAHTLLAAPQQPTTPVGVAAFRQLQAAFNIPCAQCESLLATIEAQGEAHCTQILGAACTALKVTCSPTELQFACSALQGLLAIETPAKVCTTFKCTPSVSNL